MATQDQITAYGLALQQVNAQIARLQDTASALVATLTGNGPAVQATLDLITSERDQIASVWATGDPDAQTRAVAAMQILAAGLPDATDRIKLALDPAGAAGDALSGTGSDVLGLLLVGALVYLVVIHEEERAK